MNDRGWGIVAAAYLVACLLLGGASAAGAVANATLQIAAMGVILAILWGGRRGPLPREATGLVWTIAAFLLLAALSLIPLPPSVWEALPFRDDIVEGFRLLGISDAWIPVSLAPHASVASMLSLLPPVAMFLLAAQLSPEKRRLLPGVILVVAIFSIGFGVFQLIGGPQSPLRFYTITNRGSLVSFFSNANHEATLLLCALPFAGFIAARVASKRTARTKRSGGAIISVAAALFLILGVALVGSEAGYGLFLPAAFASALIYRRAAVGRVSGRWLAALGVLFLLFVVMAMAGPLSRQALSGKLDAYPTSRGVIAATTIDAISDSFPVGTGLGTFASVYRRYEDPHRARRDFVNHAHNDYLEVALELGMAGILLVFSFLLWWARRSLHAWKNEFNGAGLARASSVVIAIVLLHSLVDYPLRTSAIAALFGMACALLVPSGAARRRPRSPSAEGESLRHVEAD